MAAEQSHQYAVLRWLGYLRMLVIMPGKLRESRYKQLTEISVCGKSTYLHDTPLDLIRAEAHVASCVIN